MKESERQRKEKSGSEFNGRKLSLGSQKYERKTAKTPPGQLVSKVKDAERETESYKIQAVSEQASKQQPRRRRSRDEREKYQSWS